MNSPMPSESASGDSTANVEQENRLKACPCCGLIQTVEIHGEDYLSRCPRCGMVVDRGQGKDASAQRTAAAAMGALVLFPAAVTLPILEIERLGYRHASSLLGGIVDLFHSGSWFVATVILLFSIVLPIVKLITLLELCWFRYLEHHHRALAYRIIEFSGRWSMMDVMLLAFLVMLIKLSGLVEFHVGPAVVAFSACVVMSMIASMSFDPHSIWAEE